jgi:hypothetical protein
VSTLEVWVGPLASWAFNYLELVSEYNKVFAMLIFKREVGLVSFK